MRTFLKKIQSALIRAIDFFYPPFSRTVPPDIFRYGACGGLNMVFDWVLYFVVFHFVLRKQILHIGAVALSAHIASLFVVFPITFATGFLLSKYVSFRGSTLRGRTQIFRYALVVGGCVVLNYVCMKVFVDGCGIFPTPAKMLTTAVTVVFSFFSQRNFTFRKS